MRLLAANEIETLLPIAFGVVYLLSVIAGIFKKKQEPQPGEKPPPADRPPRHPDHADDLDDDELEVSDFEPEPRPQPTAPPPQPRPEWHPPPQPATLRTPPLPPRAQPIPAPVGGLPEVIPEVRRRVSDPRFELPKPRIVARIVSRTVSRARIEAKSPEVHILGLTPASDDPHSLLHPEGAHLPAMGTDGRWRRLLREPDGLRNAVVLAEILAPPLALRDNHLRGAQ